MAILIDADGCPVVDRAVALARQYKVSCLILCDTAHEIQREGAMTVVVAQGADSVDFALANRLNPGDIVVTQDFGLAAICLAKQAYALDQNGRMYTNENIDGLLAARHHAKVARRARVRIKGQAKRQPQQDEAFSAALAGLLAAGAGLEG